ALAHPLSASEVAGRQLLRRARRAREQGSLEEAAAWSHQALAAWPESREARLGVAEDDLRRSAADVPVPEVDELQADEPPRLRAWSLLLRARAADRDGQRAAAVQLYKEVYVNAYRRPDLRRAAAAGIEAPYRPPASPAAPSPRPRRTFISIPTAPGAGFLEVRRFSTAASTG
ncbi:MAG TPA: hypothetical protein VMR21_04585, partial [Vicinamibacteria bacterium]|nr:hypothetical protein [Vicinamibacteria bacterium]